MIPNIICERYQLTLFIICFQKLIKVVSSKQSEKKNKKIKRLKTLLINGRQRKVCEIFVLPHKKIQNSYSYFAEIINYIENESDSSYQISLIMQCRFLGKQTTTS